ncbi:MAG: cytochrome b/b6 domain-containing protein [Gammaproteobacteria bacterium]|nr:cytochrome b/b6 domain-containing protein [Gammaproteobacteria bacterium]
MNELKAYPAWDAGVRWFHWINLLCLLGLIAVGVVILNAKTLGIPNEGKMLQKTVHVWIGYVFALNLLWRLVWAFIGTPRARWLALLPGGRGYGDELREGGNLISAMFTGRKVLSGLPTDRGPDD